MYGNSLSSPGSVYLFKGDSYWRFSFPGSSVQTGYPRSSAADWLDCPDSSSSSPMMDDPFLSLSQSAGRQELREGWSEEREGETAGEKRREHGRGEKYKDRQHRGSYIWTQCTCQNGALVNERTPLFGVALLSVWTLLAV